MASKVEICNNALFKLGEKSIVSLTDGTTRANIMNLSYDRVRRRELRAHRWNFATKRVQLAADSAAPAFGYSRRFQLPSDFLKLVPPDKGNVLNDPAWAIEGRYLLTDEAAPYDLRYIYNVEDVNEMDDLFRDALAARLAWENAYKITQSNTRTADAKAWYKDVMNEAKKANAFEQIPQEPPDSSWVTDRH